MSKGMKQKLGIVAAFGHDPEILILDEPTSGLDPLMQNRFVELITEEKRRGKTILMSSHMFGEVELTCDRIGIIRAGVLVAMDKTEALRKKHLKPYTVTLESEALAAEFARDFGGVVEGVRVHVSALPSLEEIFCTITGVRSDVQPDAIPTRVARLVEDAGDFRGGPHNVYINNHRNVQPGHAGFA